MIDRAHIAIGSLPHNKHLMQSSLKAPRTLASSKPGQHPKELPDFISWLMTVRRAFVSPLGFPWLAFIYIYIYTYIHIYIYIYI